jgi:hypothetical protein
MFKTFPRALIFAALATGVAVAASAQEIQQEGPVPTTATIMVDSKNPVQLNPNSLNVEVNGHATPVTFLRPADRGPVEIAILIDDGLRTSFGQQIGDLQKFVSSLPPNARVLIGYMQNGTVRSNGHFSADRQELSSQLRIPMGAPGTSASPYFCLQDFVKHWPSSGPAARFVLMISNGVDPYNGRPSMMNQDSPYVQAAQDDAQRAGVVVYSIYFQDAGFRGGRGSFSGQSYLQQVGDATGGMLFNEGPIPPVSIGPFLNQFGHAIQSSYEIGFMAVTNGKHNDLVRLKVKANQPGVKIHAPQDVRPGVNLAGGNVASR